MTVTYYPKIATIKYIVTLRLLMRWRGSLYKLVLPDLAIFIAIYTMLSLIYRLLLDEVQRRVFETICQFARDYSGTTTVTFCLGFFVSYVLGRWWECFKTVPWVNTPSYHIRSAVIPPFISKQKSHLDDNPTASEASPGIKDAGATTQAAFNLPGMETLKSGFAPAAGNGAATGVGAASGQQGESAHMKMIKRQYEETLQIRLNLLRYLMVAWIWLMRRISKPVLLRFKPQKNLVDCTLIDKLKVMNCDPFIQKYFAKLLTDAEIEAIVAYAKTINGDSYEKYEPDYFLPMDWAADLIHEARARGYIPTDYLARDLLQSMRDYRTSLGSLRLMDMFNVPLVYTQTVALCLYIYLVLNCFATQFTDSSKPDVYVPVPFILQLAFLFGWLRVSEVCLNPFGEDDDDFPTWQMLNMNLETSYKIIKLVDRELMYELYAASLGKSVNVLGDNPIAVGRPLSEISRRQSVMSVRNYLHGNHELQYASALRLHGDSTSFEPTIGRDKKLSIAPSIHGYGTDSERLALAFESDLESMIDDSNRAYDYNKMEKMYDRPTYMGSALETELGGKHQAPPVVSGPGHAVSILNLGMSRLMSIQPAASPYTSRSNIANTGAATGSGVGATTSNRSSISPTKHFGEPLTQEEMRALRTLLNVAEAPESSEDLHEHAT